MSLTINRLAQTKAAANLPRVFARNLATAALQKPNSTTPRLLDGKRLAQLGSLGIGLSAGQYYLGKSENFFEHKFITAKKPEDLADFYGTEDFMEVFCVFPFMVDFMMRNAIFDDNGTIHARGLLGPGDLEVSIEFDEKEIDTSGDGEPDTIGWFNKKEHFLDVAPPFLGGFKLWEMTQNFGYHRLDDGTCEVYHHGEKFNGFFPIRLLFQLHSLYVIWATEKYINSEAFGTEDLEDDLEEQRHNIPLHVFKHFIHSLTKEVKKAKVDSKTDAGKQDKLEVTLRRLETISSIDHTTSMPQLRTLRSRKTNVAHVHLLVDDNETKDTIRTAMQQIGSSKGQRHEPASEIYELAGRTSQATRRLEEKRK